MQKYINDRDEVAVLYSTGFCQSWFARGTYPEIVCDVRVVQWVLDGKKDEGVPGLLTYLWGKYPHRDFYLYQLKSLAIHWVPSGTRFAVYSQGAYERVISEADFPWMEA